MLIPGAFLLFIPTLAAMEYSAAKQRIGDQVAGTLVVREPTGARVTSGAPAMAGQAMVPIAPGVAPVVMARSGRRADQWRWPIAGSVALAATTMIATVIFTIDTAICGQVNDRYCQGDFDAPVWSGSQTAHALAIVCATLSLVALPFVIGFVIKKWVWTPISGGVWAGTFIAGVMVGLRVTRNVYASYYSESNADPYAFFVYLFLLGVGTLIPVICALLGILAGMGVDKLRA